MAVAALQDMKTPLLAVLAASVALVACGDDSSSASSGSGRDGVVPNSNIQPSPGVKGPGPVDSSGGGEAGQGPGASGGTNLDRKSGDTVSGGEKSR
jgi:hypothetical protein